jgi:hypothetical protein
MRDEIEKLNKLKNSNKKISKIPIIFFIVFFFGILLK